MKKNILFLVFVVLASLAKAQDLIITKDSERIEAQITEISDSEVKFKRLDNMDGPVFVFSSDKVASIIFANGEVYVFQEHQDSSKDDIETEKAGQASQQTLMKYDRKHFYYGEKKISEKEYNEFIKTNCVEAYCIYQKGKNIENYVGLPVLIAGGIETGVCWYYVIEGICGNKHLDKKVLTHAGIGGGLTLLSALFFTKSMSLKEKSVETFNQHCSYKAKPTDVSLSVGITFSGVGVSINF